MFSKVIKNLICKKYFGITSMIQIFCNWCFFWIIIAWMYYFFVTLRALYVFVARFHFKTKTAFIEAVVLSRFSAASHVSTGADNIKKYWSRYYQGSQGVIFILDSASSDEDLEAARNELHSALQHPQLCTLPFLILANHQDKPAARTPSQVIEAVYSVAHFYFFL